MTRYLTTYFEIKRHFKLEIASSSALYVINKTGDRLESATLTETDVIVISVRGVCHISRVEHMEDGKVADWMDGPKSVRCGCFVKVSSLIISHI